MERFRKLRLFTAQSLTALHFDVKDGRGGEAIKASHGILGIVSRKMTSEGSLSDSNTYEISLNLATSSVVQQKNLVATTLNP